MKQNAQKAIAKAKRDKRKTWLEKAKERADKQKREQTARSMDGQRYKPGIASKRKRVNRDPGPAPPEPPQRTPTQPTPRELKIAAGKCTYRASDPVRACDALVMPPDHDGPERKRLYCEHHRQQRAAIDKRWHEAHPEWRAGACNWCGEPWDGPGVRCPPCAKKFAQGKARSARRKRYTNTCRFWTPRNPKPWCLIKTGGMYACAPCRERRNATERR